MPILVPSLVKSIFRVFLFKINASPSDNGCSIASMLKVDDLPAPLGPNNPRIWPCFTPKELPQTASNPLE